jgi:GTP-binding protein HflX
VQETLAELEVDHIPEVVALNKVDRLPPGADAFQLVADDLPAAQISALTGQGMGNLLQVVESALEDNMEPITIFLPYKRGDMLTLFHQRGRVTHEEHTPEGIRVSGRVPARLIPYFDSFREDGNPA